MSEQENKETQAPPEQKDAKSSDDELLKGCLYSLMKFIGLLVAFILLLFLLVDNYDRGAKAFEKGYWDSAVFFLESVKEKDEHYEEAQKKLRIAREKIKQRDAEDQ